MPLNIEIANDSYFTDEYKTLIRSCKEILISKASWFPMQENQAFAYKNNFHKFLRNLKIKDTDAFAIDEELVWTISFINDITNPTQDFSHLPGIYIVTKEIIDSITQATRVRRE